MKSIDRELPSLIYNWHNAAGIFSYCFFGWQSYTNLRAISPDSAIISTVRWLFILLVLSFLLWATARSQFIETACSQLFRAALNHKFAKMEIIFRSLVKSLDLCSIPVVDIHLRRCNHDKIRISYLPISPTSVLFLDFIL